MDDEVYYGAARLLEFTVVTVGEVYVELSLEGAGERISFWIRKDKLQELRKDG